MCSTPSTEKRSLVRHRMKDTLFAVIQGDDCASPARVVDLNRNGIGLNLVCRGKLTDGNIIFDLMSEKNHVVLRSLSARVVYGSETSEHGNEPDDAPKRYGLEFVNLSDMEKRIIDRVVEKYALPE
jgi:hypothetical protein